MKIHCITLTKNEEDIVHHCLTEASKWADYIYVYDGLSTDGTWDIVRSLESSKIIPWKRDGEVFSETLRAEVFNEFRHLSAHGDWWIALDVDEFYGNLRETLSHIPERHDLVWALPIQYYLTWQDVAAIDFTLPIELRLPMLRYYHAQWSEPRCFRYRERLVWDSGAWPRHAGVVARQRVVFKHYQYRSPEQIQRRLDTRRDNRQRGYLGWAHACEASWKEKIVDAKDCNFDDQSGYYIIDEDKLPRHIEPVGRRLVKTFMHRSGIWP
jgi:hypothetical protein